MHGSGRAHFVVYQDIFMKGNYDEKEFEPEEFWFANGWDCGW